jgi:hypothetical protein
VIIASLDGYHLHILARFPDHNVRHWIGRAKKHGSHLVRQEGLRTEEGGAGSISSSGRAGIVAVAWDANLAWISARCRAWRRA